MPNYHSKKIGLFLIDVKPDIFIRRFWPYFVGNKVKFRIHFSRLDSAVDGTIFHIFEIFGSEERTLQKFDNIDVNNKWITVIGNPIDHEGDVIYRLGFSSNSKGSQTIVTGHATNTDRWLLALLGFFLGAIFSIFTGILLGFIQITPFWSIWIP